MAAQTFAFSRSGIGTTDNNGHTEPILSAEHYVARVMLAEAIEARTAALVESDDRTLAKDADDALQALTDAVAAAAITLSND